MNRLLNLKKKALSLTSKPGVYLMKNCKGKVIYVGKAKNLNNRVNSYFRNSTSHSDRILKLIHNIYDFDFIVTDSEFEALILECSLIKQNKPKYNVLLKDAKGFCYVKITTNNKFPTISVVSSKKNDSATYIGPYINYSNIFPIKQAVKNINEIFMLPDCNLNFESKIKRRRPCLNYYIKKCVGVCCNKISVDDYLKILNDAVNFLKNGSKNFLNDMKQKMIQASNKLDFEQAIMFRDRIKILKKISEKSKIFLKNLSSAEIISVASLENFMCFVVLKYRSGHVEGLQHFIWKNDFNQSSNNFKEELEDFVLTYYSNQNFFDGVVPNFIVVDCKTFNVELFSIYLTQKFQTKIKIKLPTNGVNYKNLANMAHSNALEILNTEFKQNNINFSLVKKLKEFLKLNKIPHRIEAYDVSNLGNSAIVGAMVVFVDGIALNSCFRKFKIKSVYVQNDYVSMEEILNRRIIEFEKNVDVSFSKKPDLILIDGGKGHVNLVKKILNNKNFKVPCFGMIKNSNHKTEALTDGFNKLNLLDGDLLGFITQIQDEVHRFAISYNKQIRIKNNLKLELTKIKGVGEKKAVQFLNILQQNKKLNVLEISKILKLNLKSAEEIKQMFSSFFE